MITHDLKTWPAAFIAVLDGRKTYDIRPADWPFKVGDRLQFREFEPHATCRGSGRCWDNGDTTDCCDRPHGRYTGRSILVEVTHITPGGEWGLPPGLCVMAIRKVEPASEWAETWEVSP